MTDDTNAFATPARRPRPSRTSVDSHNSSSGVRGSRRSSSLLGSGTESELTPSGAQILHAGLKRSGRALALQVLGVYRYIADPALRRVLPPRAAASLEWDVFDLVVSDGQMKMKAMLSPALNHLVWSGLVSELDVVEIDDYELVSVRDGDDDNEQNDDDRDAGRSAPPQRSVCIIHELTPRTPAMTKASASGHAASSASDVTMTPRAKIVYSVGSALLASPSPSLHGTAAGVPDVQFISDAHIRDHGALPLAGSRLYYLSLISDDYPAEWEPVQREALSPVSTAVPWAEWNRRRRYCTDIFTSKDRMLHMIREVNQMTSSRKRAASEMEDGSDGEAATPPSPPPMIGVVRFKSGLVHVGAPHVANEFPFMFHIVLSDRERSVEIAFFGSMAAKNFLTVQEGDLIQLQGYSISRGVERDENGKAKKLFYFPHLSMGVVSHVPDKYWSLLETMKVLEKRPRTTHPPEDSDDHMQRHEATRQAGGQSTVWLPPNFLTALETQQPDLIPQDEAAKIYFDFVGVVSYVSRMHRHRPQRDGSNPGTTESLRAYRWIKLVDCTSKNELVVRLSVNSQPTAFHAIQAGDITMLSKLQWFDARDGGKGLAFATSSVYTTIRLNDDVEPFQVFTECSENFALAKTLRASGMKTQYSAVDSPLVATTESWLEGPCVEGYKPYWSAVSMADSIAESISMLQQGSVDEDPRRHWIPALPPGKGVRRNYAFEEVASIAESMDAMSHRYLRVRVALQDIRVVAGAPGNAVSDIEFLVTDGKVPEQPLQPIRLRTNMLFKERALPSPLDEMVAEDAESLARLLTPAAIKSLNTASILRSTELPQFSSAKASVASLEAEQEITLDIVKDHILKNDKGAEGGRIGEIEVALHLYRMPHGELDLWIDAINL